ncbi:unnamed protein product [Psylliodes chrysocephalus]|uniref:Uncharacterized protein n=1 Tax=Psylliodes chrysocephalus TaxID=3402493 RepID=A0A9P0CVT0_9CUCU|nr:unnamed protein product [Psylliodes chrysocephala]
MFILSSLVISAFLIISTTCFDINNVNKNITVLKKHSYMNLNLVVSIRIQNCSVKIIEEEAFKNVSVLLLEITDNNIKNLTNGSFAEVLFVDLILDRNEIELIEEGTFNNIHPLWKGLLSLQKNNIETIEKGVFNGTDIRILSLDDNQITNIQPGAFEQMHHLRILTLSKNKLRNIGVGIFQNFPGLFSLDLSENHINKIDKLAFEDDKELFLNLENNTISTEVSKWYFENTKIIALFK